MYGMAHLKKNNREASQARSGRKNRLQIESDKLIVSLGLIRLYLARAYQFLKRGDPVAGKWLGSIRTALSRCKVVEIEKVMFSSEVPLSLVMGRPRPTSASAGRTAGLRANFDWAFDNILLRSIRKQVKQLLATTLYSPVFEPVEDLAITEELKLKFETFLKRSPPLSSEASGLKQTVENALEILADSAEYYCLSHKTAKIKKTAHSGKGNPSLRLGIIVASEKRICKTVTGHPHNIPSNVQRVLAREFARSICWLLDDDLRVVHVGFEHYLDEYVVPGILLRMPRFASRIARMDVNGRRGLSHVIENGLRNAHERLVESLTVYIADEQDGWRQLPDVLESMSDVVRYDLELGLLDLVHFSPTLDKGKPSKT